MLRGRPTVRVGATTALTGLLTVVVLSAGAEQAAAQFVRMSTNPKNILEGNWQSCQEAGSHYTERVWDHVVNGVPQFEVHLGPKREFAIFEGVQDEHREHASPANLLKPYRVPMQGMRARHRWEIPSLKLAFTVTLGGGARTDCESWYIVLEPLDKPSQ
ncbi:MAG: hypothetical protein FJW27_16485 [Acidimicrobiia bacterium]|nr:hypothetical protein [Acidimicrobiia bacterium]